MVKPNPTCGEFPCCGFGGTPPDPIFASVVGTGTCDKYTRNFEMALIGDNSWSSGDPFLDLCFFGAELFCDEETEQYILRISFYETGADEWPDHLDIPMTLFSCVPFYLSGSVSAPAVMEETGCECVGEFQAEITE
jgi:hypothetical protein